MESASPISAAIDLSLSSMEGVYVAPALEPRAADGKKPAQPPSVRSGAGLNLTDLAIIGFHALIITILCNAMGLTSSTALLIGAGSAIVVNFGFPCGKSV